MNLILLLVLLTVLGAGWFTRKHHPSLAISLVVSGTLLAVGLGMWQLTAGRPHTISATVLTLRHALGAELGKRIAHDHPGGGRVLVLQVPLTLPGEKRGHDAFLAGLKEGLNSRQYELVDRLRDEKDNGQPVSMFTFENKMVEADYLRWASAPAGAVAVIVNLPGPSPPSPETLAKLPPLYVVLSDSAAERAAWQPLVTGNQVAGAIAQLASADGDTAPAFARHYEWLSPAPDAN